MCAQHRKGGPQPALRVVSFGADRANRGPAFDMDLPELLTPEGGPIAYEDARAYFHADPAHRHVMCCTDMRNTRLMGCVNAHNTETLSLLQCL